MVIIIMNHVIITHPHLEKSFISFSLSHLTWGVRLFANLTEDAQENALNTINEQQRQRAAQWISI